METELVKEGKIIHRRLRMKKNEIVKTPAAQDAPFVIAIMQIEIDDLQEKVSKLELRMIQMEKKLDRHDRLC